MEHKERFERHMEKKMEHYVTKGFKVFFFIIIALLIAILCGYVVMWLWNWLMPELFGLPTLGYWQAVGLLILAKILFGFGGGNGPGKHSKSKKRFKSEKCRKWRRDFSEWELYDEFWAAEGEKAYQDYVNRVQNNEEETT